MDNYTINAISLCSGVGMLDEGLNAGLGYMGIRSRTVLYAEREAYPVSVLEARMEEGSIRPAPIWFGDFTELPARQFRGVVDCVVAGFPCQDISVAGKRAGLDGARSGLFFEIPRIADDCGAWLILLENVGGIASATATVVDKAVAAEITGQSYRPAGDALGEPDSEVQERAAARVVGELADLGWDAEWITISASDVGASHGRARWFCLAWRKLGNTESERSVWKANEQRRTGASGCAGEQMGDSKHFGRDAAKIGCCAAQGNDGDATRTVCACESTRSSDADGEMGNTSSEGLEESRLGGERELPEEDGAGIHDRFELTGAQLADTSSARPQGLQLGRARNHNWGGQEAHGSVSQLCRLFAPGPSDPRWTDIIRDHPELAPSLEPTFRGVVNGLAFDMGDCRAQRLKCSGNGVVPTQAAMAIILLARRAGIF